MEKIRRHYPDIAPAGPTYNRAIRSGNWLFISGCTARGTPSQGKSLMEQLRVTLDRIMRIVTVEGGTPHLRRIRCKAWKEVAYYMVR